MTLSKRHLIPVLGILILTLLTASTSIPLTVPGPIAIPSPEGLHSFERAVDRIESDRINDSLSQLILPENLPILLSPGHRTRRVVVFFHGYTNGPAQFLPLAKTLANDSTTVYIPRMPEHGFKDRLSNGHGTITAQALINTMSDAVNNATALGETLTVAGISMGGNLALLATLNRPEVKHAVVIAPALGYQIIPPSLTFTVAACNLILPNRFDWWDSELHEKNRPRHGYPRYSLRTLAQTLRLSALVFDQIKERPPISASLTLIQNADDSAISNPMIDRCANHWRQLTGSVLTETTIPQSRHLDHDIIDADILHSDTGYVYALMRKSIVPAN